MSWMQKLYETYENCRDLVGKREEENKPPLMPIYHTTQQAQIEAEIDTEGCWRSARVLSEKRERTTLIPCTENSASRTNTPAPHPLFDKLEYLAGDYPLYRKPKDDRHNQYIRQLSAWCDSPYSHPKVRAVLKYLQKGCLMADLIRESILYQDSSGSLPEQWDGKKEAMPPIFKAVSGDQAGAFVRFQVVSAGGSEDLQSRIWDDPYVWQSYMDYQNHLQVKTGTCCVLGKEMPLSSISPKYIRRPGDGAKLISANDSAGFTYRGRFETPFQAFSIGRETTEKAHNALKWLIPRQGYVNGDQVILAWKTDGGKTLDPCASSLDLMLDLEPDEPVITTGEDFAQKFRHALAGYGCRLKGGEECCILGLDSATTGRLSVFYYREMPEKDLADRVARWHETCRWYFADFSQKTKTFEKNARPVPFIGAPSPETIAEAAYGKRLNDALKKSTVQRLLPCIVDGAALPRDIMLCAVRRASNPIALDEAESRKTLAVACALIRKYYNDMENRKNEKSKTYKERWKMALDTQETDRNYLFGRALAYAQQIEIYALSLQGEPRSTNAERMQTAFSQHPAKTWKTLYQSLTPYLQRLGPRGIRYREELNEVIARIEKPDFTNNPLSELYLLGYACQMEQFRRERDANKKKNTGTEQEGVEKE